MECSFLSQYEGWSRTSNLYYNINSLVCACVCVCVRARVCVCVQTLIAPRP